MQLAQKLFFLSVLFLISCGKDLSSNSNKKNSVSGLSNLSKSNSLSSSPLINWSASTTVDVLRYEYCIGTSSGGCELKDWISNGLNLSATITGLSLVDGSIYYVSVRTIAKDLTVSSPVTSSWTVDNTAPNPANGLRIITNSTLSSMTSTSLSWTASTSPDVLRYEYCVGSSALGCEIKDWTGNGLNLTAAFTGNTISNGTYYLHVRVVDEALNVSSIKSQGWIVFNNNLNSQD